MSSSARPSRQNHPHNVTGDLVLTDVHIVEGAGLGDIGSLRWRDSASERMGQSSHARIVQYIESGGSVRVEHEGSAHPVAVVEQGGARILVTSGFDEDADPILLLPQY